jgi:hypothetical protein
MNISISLGLDVVGYYRDMITSCTFMHVCIYTCSCTHTLHMYVHHAKPTHEHVRSSFSVFAKTDYTHIPQANHSHEHGCCPFFCVRAKLQAKFRLLADAKSVQPESYAVLVQRVRKTFGSTFDCMIHTYVHFVWYATALGERAMGNAPETWSSVMRWPACSCAPTRWLTRPSSPRMTTLLRTLWSTPTRLTVPRTWTASRPAAPSSTRCVSMSHLSRVSL